MCVQYNVCTVCKYNNIYIVPYIKFKHHTLTYCKILMYGWD